MVILRLSLLVLVFVAGRQIPHRKSAPMAQNPACLLLSLLLPPAPLYVALDEHPRYPLLYGYVGNFAVNKVQASPAIYQNPDANRFRHH